MYNSWSRRAWFSYAFLVGVSSAACRTPADQGTLPAPASAAVERAAPADQTPPALACRGESFRIDILGAVQAMPDGTLANQREQLRDWVWNATLARIAHRSSVPNLFSGVADQPLLRDDALSHVLRHSVGPVRAATTKDGEVVVLIDAAANAMTPEVLEAVDAESLGLGGTPSKVHVYRYQLDARLAQAEVCNLGTYDRARLEQPEQGFRRATIRNLHELEGFLAGGVDLLSAQCTEAGLAVTGRHRPRSSGAPITPEHIAPLAQRLREHYIPAAQFGATWKSLPEESRQGLAGATQMLDALAAKPQFLPQVLASDEVPPLLKTMLLLKAKHPGVASSDVALSAYLQHQFDGKPGFSLDPAYSRSIAIAKLDELQSLLASPAQLERFLVRGGVESALAASAARSSRPRLASLERGLTSIRAALADGTDADVHATLSTHPTWNHMGEAEFRGLVYDLGWLLRNALHAQSGQQCARYDGPFAGTAAGMTFFYTDLMMKKFGRIENPRDGAQVDGLSSIVSHSDSTAWCSDSRLDQTRIWLGLQREAFARRPASKIQYAPVAVRVFARGSSIGSAESEPPAYYARFIKDWDQHYAQVANWEPQYELLNQLLKWSALVQHARESGRDQCVDFLQRAPVNRGLRFDSWTNAHPELRWRDIPSLVPEPLQTTECLPLLTSAQFNVCGETLSLTGGVSAAARAEIAAKPVTPTATPGIGRLSSEIEPIAMSPNRVRFDKLDRSLGELSAVELDSAGGDLSFKANIVGTNATGERVSQRGTYGLWRDASAQRNSKRVVHSERSIRLEEQINDLSELGLTVADLDLANIRLIVQRGELSEARALAKSAADRMLHDGTPLDVIAGTWGIDRDARLLSDGRIAVRLRAEGGQSTYAVMSSGAGNRGPPPPGHKASLMIGTPDDGDPTRGGPGSGREPIYLWLLRGDDADRYVAAQTARSLATPDATLASVRSHLGKQDLRAAEQAYAQKPTAASALRLVDEAVLHVDLALLERVVRRAESKFKSSEDLGDLMRRLAEKRVELARSGRDTRGLETLETRLAVAQARKVVPRKAELREEPAAILAPASFPAAAKLPPAVHFDSGKLPPNQRFVTRVVHFSEHVVPSKLKLADGLELEVRARRSASTRIDASAMGAPQRLLGPSYPVAVVLPCSDEEEDDDDDERAEPGVLPQLVPCHDPDRYRSWPE